MSWSGSVSQPNWGGQDNTASGGGASSVGDLYIVPDPPTIEENPSIGLEGRNEVPLPTKYRDLDVKNLTAENINGGSFDVSKWSEFPAIHDVRAELIPLPPIIIGPAPYRRQYDLFDFRNINAGNLYAQFDIANPLGTGLVAGFRGEYNLVKTETMNVSPDDETGTVSIYGSSKIAGTNALYVEGGTTLDGGTIHGTSIGSLPVAGANSIRLDVFPVGIDMISATYITLDSTVGNWATIGALSIASAGALSLAGGSYIEYNSDEHRFINTSSGNDFVDILIANIHPSYNGSANLRINGGGSGRGVELADTQSINLWTNLPIADWVNSTSYTVGTKVKFGSAWYNCVVINAYTQPDIPIPNWVTASNYTAGTVVFSAGLVYRCSSSISGSTTPPNPTSDPNWTNLGFTTNVITQIWAVYNPYVSTITGDEVSVLRIGNIQGPTAGSGVQLNQVKDLNLFTELPIAYWVNSTNYATGTKTRYLDLYYNALFPNLNLQPTLPIPAFVDTNSYNVDNIVFEAGEGAFRCVIATGPPSAWASGVTYDVGDRVEFGGLYYECAYRNLDLQPATPIPVWVSGTTYVEDQIVDYSGDTYVASGVPAPLVPPPSANWILIFIGNNINNIWVPVSINPPNANWQLIGSTNDITQVWLGYQPYQSSIDGDRFSSIEVGGMSSNFLTLAGQSYGDAILRFGSSTGSLSTIKQVNSTGQIVIDTAVGLKIDTTTSTDFSAGDVVNLKNLTLTSALNPTWSDIIPYGLNAMVERDGFNWRSEIAGNVGNIPQALLLPWLLSSNYVEGNVRYDVGANKSYLCINDISGSTTPPSGDTTNWQEFQVGSDASDVWYSMGAVVESSIVGDRLSSIEIGTQEFVGEAGTFLSVGQDISQVGTIDGTILSGGTLNVIGVDGASFGSLNGIATIGGDSVYIGTFPTTGGNILVEANDELTIGAINDASLVSTSANINITTAVGDIILNSADALTLGGANTVALGSTAGDVIITSEVGTSITATTGGIAITSDAGSITLTSATETSITAVDYINIQADTSVDIISNTSTIAITSGADTTITATAGDLSLVAGNDISLDATSNTINLNSNNLTNVGTINGYNPLLTIYKNATIGSAISRAPNTAEIQVYQQTMTLKANTQYNLNISYSLLTENASTGTPNNNWYIIYRVHGGTSPLTTANMYSAPSIFNSTQIANGVTTSFMTGSLTTYTGRFYIRNQNLTVALTVANIQASVIEVV